MAEERFLLTRQGYERLRAELADREAQDSAERDEMEDIYRDIHRTEEEDAEDFDIRTSKEYTDERIGHLKFVLERAEIMDEDPDPRRINAGDRVIVWDVQAHQERTFNLVDGEEVATLDDAVATDSPVGQALLGRTIGDTITVAVPDGTAMYSVRRVERIDE